MSRRFGVRVNGPEKNKLFMQPKKSTDQYWVKWNDCIWVYTCMIVNVYTILSDKKHSNIACRKIN
jgi:hypothetical protein